MAKQSILLLRHSGLKGVNIWRATLHCLNMHARCISHFSVRRYSLSLWLRLLCLIFLLSFVVSCPRIKLPLGGRLDPSPCALLPMVIRKVAVVCLLTPLAVVPDSTAISQSTPARASVPNPPDNGSVPTSLPSCQLDLSSMTMDCLVSVIQNQISLLTQTGAVSMSPGPHPTSLPQPVVAPQPTFLPQPAVAPQPTSLPQPVVAPLASIQSVTMSVPLAPLPVPPVPPCWQVHILVLISGVREYYYYVCVDIRYTCVLLLYMCMCYSYVLCIATVLLVNFS